MSATRLGEHTNIGGGTITANYDGVHKHHTTIGSNVHVGAGNLFVAPVEVGSGVTTGAGSVVRHDVPDDSMVYSENTQHVVEAGSRMGALNMPAVQDSIDAIRIAAAAADRMKATDLVAFDVTEPLAITDAMLVATASNERQVLAVAEEIEKDLYLKSGKRQPRSREGLTEGQWVLLDYGDFVIHSCIRNPATSTASNACGRIARASTCSLNIPRLPTKRPRKPRNNTYEHAFTFGCGRHVFVSGEIVFANFIIEKATEKEAVCLETSNLNTAAQYRSTFMPSLWCVMGAPPTMRNTACKADRHSTRRSGPMAG